MLWTTPQMMALTLICTWASISAFALAAMQIPLSNLSPHGYGDGKLGAIASESKICSQIGIDLLKSGGNAADAVSYNYRKVEKHF